MGTAGGFFSLALSHFLRSTLGGVLLGTHLLFSSAAGLLFSLTLSHLLSGTLGGLLLGAHLRFSSAAGLLLGLALRHFLGSLHFSFLLAAGGFLGLTFGHFLGATCLLFGLALRHFLGLAFGLHPGLDHLLLFRSTPGFFLLLTLHRGGFRLLACAFRFSGGLLRRHAFGLDPLAGRKFLLLLLHRRSFGLLTGLLRFSSGLFGGHALLGGLLLLLAGGSGLHACFFLLSRKVGLLRHRAGLFSLLLRGDGSLGLLFHGG